MRYALPAHNFIRMNFDTQKYKNARMLSIESPSIYNPDDGKEIKIEGLLGVSGYESKGKKIKPEVFFNGSICRWKGRNVFAFRADQEPWWDNIRVGTVELDGNYDPIIGTEQFLDLYADGGNEHHVEDPRLIAMGDRLFISYTDGRKMYHSELDDSLAVKENFGEITKFSVNSAGDKRDKNFVPFVYDGKIYYSYSDSPRIVIDASNPNSIHLPRQDVTWDFGQIRGGTPAIPFDGSLISFFHSSVIVNTNVTVRGQRVYYFGAYLFSPTPPFSIRKVTQIPLMKANPFMINGRKRPTNSFVVFPCGVIEETDHFVVSYGWNDFSTRIIRIQKTTLKLTLQ